MMVKPSASPMMTSANRNLERENKAQSWKPFWHLLKSVKFPWLLIILCTVLSLTQGTLMLIFPQYTEQIYAGNFSMSLAVTAVLVVLGQSLLGAVQLFLGEYTSRLSHMRFQNYIWRKLSRLPMSYYDKNEPRDLISRITTDTQKMSSFMANGISNIIVSVYTFAGALVMITSYDWRLTASLLICLPLCYVVGIIAGKVYYKMNNRIQGRLSDMTRYFSAVLPYITLVKLFGQENREEQQGNLWIQRYFDTTMRNCVNDLVILFASTVTTLAQTLTIIFVGLALIHEGAIDIGQWVAFYMYGTMLNRYFSSIMGVWQSLKMNQGACARISDATDAAPEENKGTLDAK